MKTENKIIIGLIIIGIAFIIFIAYLDSPKDVEEDFVKCLGENSILYIKEGCPYSQTQKNMFGDKLNLLTIVDCAEELDVCIENNINEVPTWVFDEIKFIGVQPLSLLENITGCYND